jgi:hypothetical protein
MKRILRIDVPLAERAALSRIVTRRAPSGGQLPRHLVLII